MKICARHRLDSFIFSSRRFSTRWLALAAATLLAAAMLGCGLPAAPQPPSLHLPKPVRDLQAERTGDQVQLTWTAPKATTDGLKLQAPIPVRICVQTTSRVCDTVGNMQIAPGKPAAFTYLLPASFTQGPLRVITYQVFAQNAGGHAVAASNDALVLAGAALQPVTGLTVQVIPQGVLLHWQTAPLADGTVFEIQRTLLKSPPSSQANNGASPALPPTPQKPSATKKSASPITDTLRVQPKSAADPGAALDTSVQWEATYSYTIVRVVEYPAVQATGTATLRMQSLPSEPVQLQALDTFPPATPQGLVAVIVSAAMNGGKQVVDLSWAANTEPDFAQYRVYRRELAANGMAPNDRASADATVTQLAPAAGAAPSALLVTPAFQDNTVLPGHRYAYSVSAVDLYGNTSIRTPEVLADISTAPASSQ